MSTNSHVVAYVRVSNAGQNEARQIEALGDLDQYAKIFTEKISAKDRERPELKAMISYVREGDTVRMKSIDRLARSSADLLAIVQELHDKGVAVEFIDNPDMNITTAQGKFMLTVMAVFAELERETIKERQREGVALAKAEGRYKKTPKLTPEQVAEAAEKREQGVSVADLAKDFGVSRQTLYTALKAI